MSQMTEGYLTTDEVAAHYRTVPGTVRYWRHIGYGPRGTKVGRKVLYPEGEIRRFDARVKQEITGTVDEVSAA